MLTQTVCATDVAKNENRIRPLTKCDIQRRSLHGSSQDLYDLIIVGAGTAGSLLCYRMAERYPNKRILVLDVGQDDVRTDVETLAVPNPNSPFDPWGQLLRGGPSGISGEGCAQWQVDINTTTNVQDVRVPPQLARGATLGGTSAINATIFNRGTKEGTYDRWEAATGEPQFGFFPMIDAYKKIENRTQSYLVSSVPGRFWDVNGPTPGQTLNPLMGTDGRMYLRNLPITGWNNRAIIESVAEAPLPGRDASWPINQADVDLQNSAIEYHYFSPLSHYSQSDPNFSSFNPYPANTPGYTYVPPQDPANAKGSDYAGPGPGSPKYDYARCYAAPAYLYPIMDQTIPNNVTIKERVFVTKLLFDENDPTEVIGVEYAEGPNGEGWQVSEINRSIARDVAPYKGTLSEVDRRKALFDAAVRNQENIEFKQAYAKADVWVCCGAIDSPALLQRSGVGPRALFESLNFLPVDTRIDLPGVGTGAQDTLDMALLYQHEVDFSTQLPAPFPAGVIGIIYSSFFGFADPTNPFSPQTTSSMTGIPLNFLGSLRGQSDPSKKFADFDLIVGDFPPFGTFGNTFYQDTANLTLGLGLNADFNKLKPVFNRAKWGMWQPSQDPNYLHWSGFATEYWDVNSQGEVKIRSGNVFERPEYSPNMIADDRDIDAMGNIFTRTIFPIAKRMAEKRYGPRGISTYFGAASAGGASSITLSPVIIPIKPILGNISQATYNAAGSLNGYSISIVAGTGAGQNNLITSWSGSPSYIATVLLPWSTQPDATSIYSLNPPGASPLESVEFSDDNHRNFVRFIHPNGDELFSTVVESALVNPFTTSAQSTRVRVDQPNHGFITGDMIKISGVNAPVDNIAPENFNDYHIVYKIDDNAYDIILFWNKTPLGGPGSSSEPNPAQGAIGQTDVGGSVTIHTLYFDEGKFAKWLLNHYYSGWHACCTLRMGKPDDSLAVVDSRARVYEAKGLRVVDASIFPTKPNANTQAPVYGLTQKLFDLISEEEYDHLFDCQKPPVLLSAVADRNLHIKGYLKSLKNSKYVLSFYSDNSLVGEKVVKTDKHGKAKFGIKLNSLPSGSELYAVATRLHKTHRLETSASSNTITVE